jgi:hypothetical protein
MKTIDVQMYRGETCPKRNSLRKPGINTSTKKSLQNSNLLEKSENYLHLKNIK